MKNELQNGILVIDGLPKFCPYQQPVMHLEQQTALTMQTQQPKMSYTHQPCGEWCALFKKNVTDGKLRSVGLWCSTLRIEINNETAPEPTV